MLVADLRHYLDMPGDAPGPARRVAEQLSAAVRAATAMGPAAPWVSALTCVRRPGRRPCAGRIAIAMSPADEAIEWRCTSCDDAGVIRGWRGTPFDLSAPTGSSWADRSRGSVQLAVPVDVTATLRAMVFLDRECERAVFAATSAADGHAVLSASLEVFEELADSVAAEANHETGRRQKHLDAAFDALTRGELPAPALPVAAPGRAPTQPSGIAGRWRIAETALWDDDDLDMAEPAVIEFGRARRGSLSLLAITATLDWRPAQIDARAGAEFSFEGFDEGDPISGRGWAALGADGTVRGHLFFHMGDDSTFRAVAEG